MTDLAHRAAALDAADTLAALRQEFHVPDGVIYLDGNSLGLLQPRVAARVADTIQREWGENLIRSWTDAGWFQMPMTVGDRLAPLLGVGQGEVAVGDSTSVNLFKCLAAALHLQPDRKVILAEGDNFPTDSYMAQGLAELVPGVAIRYVEPELPIEKALTSDVAVVLASHVDYRSARIRNMPGLNEIAHGMGALTLWDLSHSTGAVPVALQDSAADMAVGCTYKYLNGGPGAPAFTWVNPKHLPRLKQPLAGWMGHADPFAFTRGYAPAPGARRLVAGTPQIASLAALDEALKIWEHINRDALFAKGRAMTQFFIEAVTALCAKHDMTLVVPRDANLRGSHVSFSIANGFEIMQALISRGVIGDFRAPSIIRFGFAPLYLSFTETLRAAEHLADILDTRAWDNPKFRVRGAVT